MKQFRFSNDNYNKYSKNYERKFTICIIKIIISIALVALINISNGFIENFIFIACIYSMIINIFKLFYLILDLLIDTIAKNSMYVYSDNLLYKITCFNNKSTLEIDNTISSAPHTLKSNILFRLLVIIKSMRKKDKMDCNFISENIEEILKSPSAYNELEVSRIFQIYSLKEKNNKYEIICSKVDFKTSNESIKIKESIYKYYENFDELIEIITNDFFTKN